MTPQKSFQQYFENPQKSDKKVSFGNTCKVGCVSPMVIWSDFRIRQYLILELGEKFKIRVVDRGGNTTTVETIVSPAM